MLAMMQDISDQVQVLMLFMDRPGVVLPLSPRSLQLGMPIWLHPRLTSPCRVRYMCSSSIATTMDAIDGAAAAAALVWPVLVIHECDA